MTCPECIRLWRSYAKATTDHVNLLNEQTQAAAAGDVRRLAELELLITHAESNRHEAKASIRYHESRAHPEQAIGASF